MALSSFLSLSCLLFGLAASAQPLASRLETVLQRLSSDEQFASSVLAMRVVNSNTGQVVFEHNAHTGMAPASCQKIITSITAFEQLGTAFRYTTTLGIRGDIREGILNGEVVLTGSGDPTLGSWRYGATREERVLSQWTQALQQAGIRSITGNIGINDSIFSTATIPDGWIWQDIGNYYGAGASGFNWRENQFDLTLRSGNAPGDKVSIVRTTPEMPYLQWTNELTTAAKGSGDNAYIYLAPYTWEGFLRGTIPAGESAFTISGAVPDPGLLLTKLLSRHWTAAGMPIRQQTLSSALSASPVRILHRYQSPALDSMNYWFLKKSINLYGEALVKTLAAQKKRPGNTDSGVALIRRFWEKAGIPVRELRLMDGSGLSPQNRVTVFALTTMLQYARTRPWFTTFLNALPVMNGITMKDGYINGVRAYTGYVKSKDGTPYSFAFIVNNFYGSPATVRAKMWAILDLLK